MKLDLIYLAVFLTILFFSSFGFITIYMSLKNTIDKVFCIYFVGLLMFFICFTPLFYLEHPHVFRPDDSFITKNKDTIFAEHKDFIEHALNNNLQISVIQKSNFSFVSIIFGSYLQHHSFVISGAE